MPRTFKGDYHTGSASNRARNIAFELLLCSKLAQVGIEFDLRPGSDVSAVFEKRPFLFECKRPQSESALEARVHNAFKQLERKYALPANSRARGIIALDITKVRNPEFDFYIQPDADALRIGLATVMDQFIERHNHLWQRKRNKKTIGVLLRFSVIGVSRADNELMVYCQEFAVNPINAAGQANSALARRFTDRLNLSDR